MISVKRALASSTNVTMWNKNDSVLRANALDISTIIHLAISKLSNVASLDKCKACEEGGFSRSKFSEILVIIYVWHVSYIDITCCLNR